MAARLRGKTQILLGPKFKLELFYSFSLCLSLSFAFTHTHSQNLTGKKKRTQLKELGPSQMRTHFGKVNQFFFFFSL